MDKKTTFPTIGFIGTGAITTAIITGLCERVPEKPYPIVVSPRNAHNAAFLKKSYPGRVTIAQSLQQVADSSDWLILAVAPEIGEEICRGIKFRPEHKVINLLTDKVLPEVKSWIGKTAVLVHMVPLTFNAICDGPIVLYPPLEEAVKIFGDIGVIIQVEERYHAAVLAAVTGCVTPFYTMIESLMEWVKSQGVPGPLAANYVTSFFRAICEQAVQCNEQQLHNMADEATPGSINQMVKDILEEQGGFNIWTMAMDAAIKRLAENIPQ